MALVKYYMTKNPITVKTDMSLDQIEEVFVQNHLTVSPLLDPNDNPVGVISDFMLVKMFLRQKSTQLGNDIINYVDDLDPMITVEEDEPIKEAFKLMIQSPNHRIFVTKRGELVGALSPKDLLPFLVGKEKENPVQKEAEFKEAKRQIEKLLIELSTVKTNLVSYQQFFDESPFMMHSLDWTGKIVMANKMLHYTLGYNDGELIGQHLSKLYSYQNIKDAEEGLQKIRTLGFHTPTSTLMVKKNNETIKVDVATMIRRDENEVPIGTISITRLSETKGMMQVLREAAAVFQIDARERRLEKLRAQKK